MAKSVRQQIRARMKATGESYMTARQHVLASVQAEVKEVNTALECPQCVEQALIVGDDEKVQCDACGYKAPPEEAANDYLTNVIGLSEYEFAKGGDDWPIEECPDCDAETLIDIGVQEDAREDGPRPIQHVCFACGSRWREGVLRRCVECNRLKNMHGEVICSLCFNVKIATE